jgi:hypothetical protein
VICATGDSFVTSRDPWLVEQGVDLVDMELFAIAAACERAGVSWRSFKYITDDANEDSGDHWEANVHQVNTLLHQPRVSAGDKTIAGCTDHARLTRVKPVAIILKRRLTPRGQRLGVHIPLYDPTDLDQAMYPTRYPTGRTKVHNQSRPMGSNRLQDC